MSRQNAGRELLFGSIVALSMIALGPSAGMAASANGRDNSWEKGPAFGPIVGEPAPQPLSFAGCVRRTFLELAAIDPDSSVAFLRATAWHLCGR
jgi:hypothetical protein